ncbi:hypothetical protein LTR36_010907 [Oleoguttula mirabilis]|uniref:USP domain-containing protein n=1 Tax=Oleoguttula mirabilis TaxID=1507867 RepID=A0AAV9J4C4_9PEZI|nr:hypothetical protein LTR36_010907 [Oleoguttula mirabilis]
MPASDFHDSESAKTRFSSIPFRDGHVHALHLLNELRDVREQLIAGRSPPDHDVQDLARCLLDEEFWKLASSVLVVLRNEDDDELEKSVSVIGFCMTIQDAAQKYLPAEGGLISDHYETAAIQKLINVFTSLAMKTLYGYNKKARVAVAIVLKGFYSLLNWKIPPELDAAAEAGDEGEEGEEGEQGKAPSQHGAPSQHKASSQHERAKAEGNVRGETGLRNGLNTCFQNIQIWAFVFSDRFMERLWTFGKVAIPDLDGDLTPEDLVARDVLMALFQALREGEVDLSLKRLDEFWTVQQNAPKKSTLYEYRPGRQQDTSEFLSLCLAQVLKRYLKDAWELFFERMTRRACCHRIDVVQEPPDITLKVMGKMPKRGVVDLVPLLANELTSFDDGVVFDCPHCNTANARHGQTARLVAVNDIKPDIYVHLGLFESVEGVFRKLPTRVRIPQGLFPVPGLDDLYYVKWIGIHDGARPTEGHYYCYARGSPTTLKAARDGADDTAEGGVALGGSQEWKMGGKQGQQSFLEWARYEDSTLERGVEFERVQAEKPYLLLLSPATLADIKVLCAEVVYTQSRRPQTLAACVEQLQDAQATVRADSAIVLAVAREARAVFDQLGAHLAQAQRLPPGSPLGVDAADDTLWTRFGGEGGVTASQDERNLDTLCVHFAHTVLQDAWQGVLDRLREGQGRAHVAVVAEEIYYTLFQQRDDLPALVQYVARRHIRMQREVRDRQLWRAWQAANRPTSSPADPMDTRPPSSPPLSSPPSSGQAPDADSMDLDPPPAPSAPKRTDKEEAERLEMLQVKAVEDTARKAEQRAAQHRANAERERVANEATRKEQARKKTDGPAQDPKAATPPKAPTHVPAPLRAVGRMRRADDKRRETERLAAIADRAAKHRLHQAQDATKHGQEQDEDQEQDQEQDQQQRPQEDAKDVLSDAPPQQEQQQQQQQQQQDEQQQQEGASTESLPDAPSEHSQAPSSDPLPNAAGLDNIYRPSDWQPPPIPPSSQWDQEHNRWLDPPAPWPPRSSSPLSSAPSELYDASLGGWNPPAQDGQAPYLPGPRPSETSVVQPHAVQPAGGGGAGIQSAAVLAMGRILRTIEDSDTPESGLSSDVPTVDPVAPAPAPAPPGHQRAPRPLEIPDTHALEGALSSDTTPANPIAPAPAPAPSGRQRVFGTREIPDTYAPEGVLSSSAASTASVVPAPGWPRREVQDTYASEHALGSDPPPPTTPQHPLAGNVTLPLRSSEKKRRAPVADSHGIRPPPPRLPENQPTTVQAGRESGTRLPRPMTRPAVTPAILAIPPGGTGLIQPPTLPAPPNPNAPPGSDDTVLVIHRPYATRRRSSRRARGSDRSRGGGGGGRDISGLDGQLEQTDLDDGTDARQTTGLDGTDEQSLTGLESAVERSTTGLTATVVEQRPTNLGGTVEQRPANLRGTAEQRTTNIDSTSERPTTGHVVEQSTTGFDGTAVEKAASEESTPRKGFRKYFAKKQSTPKPEKKESVAKVATKEIFAKLKKKASISNLTKFRRRKAGGAEEPIAEEVPASTTAGSDHASHTQSPSHSLRVAGGYGNVFDEPPDVSRRLSKLPIVSEVDLALRRKAEDDAQPPIGATAPPIPTLIEQPPTVPREFYASPGRRGRQHTSVLSDPGTPSRNSRAARRLERGLVLGGTLEVPVDNRRYGRTSGPRLTQQLTQQRLAQQQLAQQRPTQHSGSRTRRHTRTSSARGSQHTGVSVEAESSVSRRLVRTTQTTLVRPDGTIEIRTETEEDVPPMPSLTGRVSRQGRGDEEDDEEERSRKREG